MRGISVTVGIGVLHVALAVGGCSGPEGPAQESSTENPADSESVGSESTIAESKVKLFVFDCGRLGYDSIEMLGIADEETDVRDLIVPCFVIEHDRGRLLWEGGLPSSYAEQEGWKEMDGGWRLRLDQTFERQIAALEWTLSDFEYMAFSHFHFDHVGVIGELDGAKLLIQREEFETAFESTAPPGYPNDLYGDLDRERIQIVDGEHDVFGDGRVRLIPAPGHTPGHQVLFVDLAETGAVVLAGDLYVFGFGREARRVLTIDADPESSARSMEEIEAMVKDAGASLWIGHDLARFEAAPKPPGFLD